MADKLLACLRCTAAKAHANRLAAALETNNARLADIETNNARLADSLGAVERQLRESAQRIHDLITSLMAALDERLRKVFTASADQVTEFKELLSIMKFTAGTIRWTRI